MNRRSFLATGLALSLRLPAIAATSDPLPQGFARPPHSARPHTWWHWMNGNISKEGITADLEAMAAVGIGGAQIFNVDQGIPAGKVPFLSPAWIDAVDHAAKEARRLGLELCLHNCAGWSSSGGPWITPEYSMQMLTWSETGATGGKTLTVTLPAPPQRAGFYKDIAVVALRKPGDDVYRIPDIRAKALFERGGAGIGTLHAPAQAVIPRTDVHILTCSPDGALTWEAPSGEWLLIRMGHTSTGEGNHPAPRTGYGLECDKFSRAAMDLHWENGIAPILKSLGPTLAGKTLNNSLIDSYEVGTQNWTTGFDREFAARRGYDPLPWLAVVTGRVIGSAEQSERFLWDMRRVGCDLFAENYAGRFKELCHENGLLFSVEPYGNGPFDELQVGEQADIPMGEFWVGGGAAETIKTAASSAHVTGRTVVGAESFTGDENHSRWLTEPYGIKTLGDRMYTQGLNRCIFHRYAHQPWIGLDPGMTMGPWGTQLERTITWWNQAKPWMIYLARCQFLLQTGRPVADVLTFSGEDAPGGLYRPSLPPGFDYDGCERTILMGARVERGQVVLPSGARYRVLLLPDSRWMTPEMTTKLVALSKAGATIVGRAPEASPSLGGYPACDADVKTLAAQLHLTPPDELARVLGTPDVVVPEGTPLLWTHRRTDEADLYFVSNQRYANVSSSLGFRVPGGSAPQLWHPETGQTEPAPLWQAAGDHTRVTLHLGPAESVFVVFPRAAAAAGQRRHFVSIERIGGPSGGDKAPTIRIEKAVYEAVDGAGGADVTAKVREMVARGETEIPATNSVFGDPINLHVKRLRVIYTLGGKSQEKTVAENNTLDLAGFGADTHLPEFELTSRALRAYSPGAYIFTEVSGARHRIENTGAQAQPLTAPWTLSFPPHRGAPASVTLKTLASWTEHPNPGVKYFSGSATYETRFSVKPQKGHALILDLGRVKNFAEVRVNGKPLPTLWKAPWRLDLTGLVAPGENTLTVRVTNLWVNRLIGDEHCPEDAEWSGPRGPLKAWPQWLLDGTPRPKTGRVAFATWRFWTREDTPLESGLLGPVRLLHVPVVPIS